MAETQTPSLGYGATLFIDGVDGTPVEIHHVKSVRLPKNKRERVEVTHLKSPGYRREFIPGLFEDDEVTAVINYRPGSATDTLLIALTDPANTGAPRDVKISVPLNGTLIKDVTFAAYISFETGDMTIDGVMEATITMSVTGAVTIADHA